MNGSAVVCGSIEYGSLNSIVVVHHVGSGRIEVISAHTHQRLLCVLRSYGDVLVFTSIDGGFKLWRSTNYQLRFVIEVDAESGVCDIQALRYGSDTNALVVGLTSKGLRSHGTSGKRGRRKVTSLGACMTCTHFSKTGRGIRQTNTMEI